MKTREIKKLDSVKIDLQAIEKFQYEEEELSVIVGGGFKEVAQAIMDFIGIDTNANCNDCNKNCDCPNDNCGC